MWTRRFAALAAVGALLTAGCLGVITGSGPAVFEASPASVGEDALAGTDFEPDETRVSWTNRTVDVAGQEREVHVKNHVATYERPATVGPVDGPTVGVFAVLATPEASIAGQAMNPVGSMDHRELVERIGERSADFREVQREDSRTIQVLGSDAEVVRFGAVVERSGVEVPVYIEVTRVRHDGDFVIGLGVYPQGSEEMRSQVRTLLGGIQH